MKNKFSLAIRVFLVVLLSVFFAQAVFAGSRTYTESTGKEFYVESWNTVGAPLWDINEFTSPYLTQQASTSNSYTFDFMTNLVSKYEQVLFYPKNTEDFVLRSKVENLIIDYADPLSFSFGKYYISDNKCKIQNFNVVDSTVSFDSNLGPWKVYGYNESGWVIMEPVIPASQETYFNLLLNKYYNMKTQVKAELLRDGVVVDTIYPAGAIAGSGSYSNYVLVKPEQTSSHSFNLPSFWDTYFYYGEGSYQIRYLATPIDLKCDFSVDGALQSNEFEAGSQINDFYDIYAPNVPVLISPEDSVVLTGDSVTLVASVSHPNSQNMDVFFIGDGFDVNVLNSVASGSQVQYVWSGLSEGVHSWTVEADDGNFNVFSEDRSFTIANPPVYSDLSVAPTSPQVYSPIENYSFSSRWSDDSGMANVKLVFDGAEYVASNAGDLYNVSFTGLDAGNYTYKWVGIDIFGNVNETANFTYEITKADSDIFLMLNGLVGDTTIQAGGDVLIEAALFDPVNENLSIYRDSVEIAKDVNFLSFFEVFNEIGSFVIDAVFEGNNNYNPISENYTVNVIDSIKPEVFDLIPSGDTFEAGSMIEISANVTDFVGVDDVVAQITLPDSSLVDLVLNNSIGNKYNVSYVPAQLGRYNVSFVANDTSGNVNDTETSYFNVVDTTSPAVYGAMPDGDVVEAGSSINLSVNVSDFVVVDNVTAIVTYPNSTIMNVTLANVAGDKYEALFDVPLLIGVYDVEFVANDTSGNLNSTNVSFSAVDTKVPEVVSLSPLNGSLFNLSDIVEISANISDVFGVDEVVVQITLPNGSVDSVVLVNVSDVKFNASYTVASDLIGVYEIVFTANDSNGNVNDTEVLVFEVVDTIAPEVFDLIPGGETFEAGSMIEISANVSDVFGVDGVYASVILPDGSSVDLVLNNSVGDKYNFSYLIPAQLGRYNVSFVANDTSGNVNDTEASYFEVVDTTAPAIWGGLPSGESFDYGMNVNLSVSVSDYVGVTNVTAFITYPNSTIVNITLVNGTGYLYERSFVVPSVAGLYNVNFVANDTSGNLNVTGVSFTGVDPNAVVSPPPTPSSSGGSRRKRTEDSCSYEWVCSSWTPSLCFEEGVQRRTCVNVGTCDLEEGKPEEERPCEVMNFDEDDFDMNLEVDSQEMNDGTLILNVDVKDVNSEEEVEVYFMYKVFSENGSVLFEESELRSVLDDVSFDKSLNVSVLNAGAYSINVDALAKGKVFSVKSEKVTDSSYEAVAGSSDSWSFGSFAKGVLSGISGLFGVVVIALSTYTLEIGVAMFVLIMYAVLAKIFVGKYIV